MNENRLLSSVSHSHCVSCFCFCWWRSVAIPATVPYRSYVTSIVPPCPLHCTHWLVYTATIFVAQIKPNFIDVPKRVQLDVLSITGLRPRCDTASAPPPVDDGLLNYVRALESWWAKETVYHDWAREIIFRLAAACTEWLKNISHWRSTPLLSWPHSKGVYLYLLLFQTSNICCHDNRTQY